MQTAKCPTIGKLVVIFSMPQAPIATVTFQKVFAHVLKIIIPRLTENSC